ncbi:hypothetical protein [Neorhizobium sp. NCHU2750]|uniref:hypothetical protein n=1 Tax=Neorhizobium sp. NCHU2750 TaxID=1825976 RepID=UPI000E73678E|nr:hypothetical protein NCHU2750_06080 [Neorhizobium sp. NCHU2750]
MSVFEHPMSQKLFDQIDAAHRRNPRVVTLHYRAEASCEPGQGAICRDRDTYDFYVNEMIERGICWRDPHARRLS